MKIYYVYILECSDGTFYTGVTNNLDRRLSEHNQGLNKKGYTYSRRPLAMKKSFDFNNIIDAIDFEKQIKRWSHGKKLALINEDWDSIKILSLSRQARNDNISQPS